MLKLPYTKSGVGLSINGILVRPTRMDGNGFQGCDRFLENTTSITHELSFMTCLLTVFVFQFTLDMQSHF